MEIVVKPREWGNSLGVTIPKEIVEKENITCNDELVMSFRKKNDIRALRGLIKSTRSTEEIMKEIRKGWD